MAVRGRGNRPAFDRYEQVARVPVTVLSFVMVPILLIPLCVTLTGWLATAFNVADYTGWAIFSADYAIRLVLVPTPGHYARTHLFDLLVIVLWLLPIVTVPRGVAVLRLVLGVRAFAFLASGIQHARELVGDLPEPPPAGPGVPRAR